MPQFNDHFIQAHRGASGAFPENTMRALVEAAAAGVRSIETDLSLLSDDSFAIFHDSKLGRTVNGDKAISELDAKSLSEYDAGSWRGSDFAGETIPALMDVLKWQHKTGIGFNWEIKPHVPNSLSNSDIEYRVLCKRHANALNHAFKGINPALNMVSTYDRGCLAEMKMMMPNIARALIAERLPKDWRNIADELKLEGFHLNHEMLTKEQVEAIHSVGLAIRCYTVNEQMDMDRLVAFGVDTAITDWPEQFISLDKPIY